MRETEIEEFGY